LFLAIQNKYLPQLQLFHQNLLATMGQIFIAATYGGIEISEQEPNGALNVPTEAPEMLLLRDLIVPELRSRGFSVISVPDFERVQQSIEWIDRRAQPGDVALGIHADAYSQAQVHGASVFYISKNDERKNHAQMLLSALCTRIANLPNMGVKPDSATALGSLAFCRRVPIPSLMLEIGLQLSLEDRVAQQQELREVAAGVADGLAFWSQAMKGNDPIVADYVAIELKVDEEIYGEKGIEIDGNVYVPIDLADRLGANLATSPWIRRVRYRGTVYVKAIELRDFHIAVGPRVDCSFQLRSHLPVTLDQIERIVGQGQTTADQLYDFLAVNNREVPRQLASLPQIYVQECAIEGISHDLAFVQMCLETNFLRIKNQSDRNNFASLGNGNAEWAAFSTIELGVKAHVQQLKAYASNAEIQQPLVAPRFSHVRRGVAPTIRQLTGRWSTDSQYALKLLAMLRRLYEFTKMF
jgi:Mannosyl-glycoprotein endo-beta-N-acetylglucosaminidase/N-acetylmuramoyl-L-alanine amidase